MGAPTWLSVQPRQIITALAAFAGLPRVTLEDPALAAKALEWTRSGMDFADALHLAKAEGCEAFVSFDQPFAVLANAVSDVEVASRNQVLAAAIFVLTRSSCGGGLLANGYGELAIAGERVVAIADLPPLHKDPFDRLLVAQSTVEGILLITTDPVVPIPGPVRNVGTSGDEPRL